MAAQRLTNLYLASAVLGFLDVILRFAAPMGSVADRITDSTIDVLLAVVIVLVAVRAKRELDRAPMRASWAGAIYSLITGIGNFLFPPSASALRKAMLGANSTITHSQVEVVVQYMGLVVVRVLELVGTVVAGWFLALALGWIVSRFVRAGGDTHAA